MAFDWGTLVGGITSGLTGIAQLGVNLYRAQQQDQFNQRDFDYQVALQREMFEREDNAVQRRMSDLEAAGLNPNLAAGSSAGAGAVVGRSSTGVKDINVGNPVGTALDVASHVMQLRNLREQNKILKNEAYKSESDAWAASMDNLYSNAEIAYMLGMNPKIMVDEEGSPVLHVDANTGLKDLDTTRLGEILRYQLQNNKNSADLLQKDVNFYNADKVAEYFGAGVSAFSGIGGGLNSFGKFNRYYRR